MNQHEIKERRQYIFDRLKKGRTPKEIINNLVDDGLSFDYAEKEVYRITKLMRMTLDEMSESASTYYLTMLKGVLERAADTENDKLLLEALDRYAKILKLTDDSVKLDVKFKWDEE